MQGLARASEKPPGAGTMDNNENTMDNNEKNNAQNNGNSRKSGRVPASGYDAPARRCQVDRVRWQKLRMSLGAKQSAPEAVGSGRANVTLHLMPCANRARNVN